MNKRFNNGIKGNKNTQTTTTNSHNTTTNSRNNIKISNKTINQYISERPINPLENMSNRTTMKNKIGSEIQIWCYGILKYIRNENQKESQTVRYTVINIHEKEKYLADHLQVSIPRNLYDENIKK